MRGVSLLIVSKFYHILMVSSCAQWQPLTTCPILLHWWNNNIIQFILPTILPSFHLFKIQNPHNIETMLWKTNYNYWFIPPSTWRWLWIFCDPAACTAPVACIYHSKVMTSSSYPPPVTFKNSGHRLYAVVQFLLDIFKVSLILTSILLSML